MKIKLDRTTLSEVMLNLIKDKLELRHELDEKNCRIIQLEKELNLLHNKIA